MVEFAYPLVTFRIPAGTWRQRLFRCFRRGLVRSGAAELRRVPRHTRPLPADGPATMVSPLAAPGGAKDTVAHLRCPGSDIGDAQDGTGDAGLAAAPSRAGPLRGRWHVLISGVARREARSPSESRRPGSIRSRLKVGSRVSPTFDEGNGKRGVRRSEGTMINRLAAGDHGAVRRGPLPGAGAALCVQPLGQHAQL